MQLKHFKVTILVPVVRVVDAVDIIAASNVAKATRDRVSGGVLTQIIEVQEKTTNEHAA